MNQVEGNQDNLESSIKEAFIFHILSNPTVQHNLNLYGYTQTAKPTKVYNPDTPINTDNKQIQTMSELLQRQKETEYYGGLDEYTRNSIFEERQEYQKTIEYLGEELNRVINILSNNQYGLGTAFIQIYENPSILPKEILNIMQVQGITVTEIPHNEGFAGNKSNHGIVRYIKDGWKAFFDQTALTSLYEIMHEFSAIEEFSLIMREFGLVESNDVNAEMRELYGANKRMGIMILDLIIIDLLRDYGGYSPENTISSLVYKKLKNLE